MWENACACDVGAPALILPQPTRPRLEADLPGHYQAQIPTSPRVREHVCTIAVTDTFAPVDGETAMQEDDRRCT